MTGDASALACSLDLALWLHAPPDRATEFLAQTLISLGRPDAALAHLDRLLLATADDPGAWMAHARALRGQGQREAALASLDRTLTLAPTWTEALINRGLLLLELRRFDEALATLDRARAAEPDNLTALTRGGEALLALGRPDHALRRFERVLALRPDHTRSLAGRATALNDLDRLDETLEAIDAWTALEPDNAAARWNQALVLLALGQFRRGWRLFEQRWNLDGAWRDQPQVNAPPWRGETDLRGRRILLFGEQGLGDSIQFCRYIPLLARRGAIVLLSVPEPLVRLMRTLDGVDRVVAETEAPPAVDLLCPLMSLPLACDTDMDSIPANVPYLHPDPAASAMWLQRLRSLPGPRIGLVWSGNPRRDDPDLNALDSRRSMPLAAMAPIARIPGVSFVSLQKGDAAAQAVTPPRGMVLHDWTGELDDFADTAALVAALDLVITVDTSVVHLAGALGKPVWLLNRFGGCWRWLRERTDSPWYPTLRLFRQHARGDWDGVMTDVAAALMAEIQRAAPGISPASSDARD